MVTRLEKQPANEDPRGLLVHWERSSTSLRAVQLPRAAPAEITAVIGLCQLEGGADKECLTSSELEGNSLYTFLRTPKVHLLVHVPSTK